MGYISNVEERELPSIIFDHPVSTDHEFFTDTPYPYSDETPWDSIQYFLGAGYYKEHDPENKDLINEIFFDYGSSESGKAHDLKDSVESFLSFLKSVGVSYNGWFILAGEDYTDVAKWEIKNSELTITKATISF